jgi:hypothetical protein
MDPSETMGGATLVRLSPKGTTKRDAALAAVEAMKVPLGPTAHLFPAPPAIVISPRARMGVTAAGHMHGMMVDRPSDRVYAVGSEARLPGTMDATTLQVPSAKHAADAFDRSEAGGGRAFTFPESRQAIDGDAMRGNERNGGKLSSPKRLQPMPAAHAASPSSLWPSASTSALPVPRGLSIMEHLGLRPDDFERRASGLRHGVSGEVVGSAIFGLDSVSHVLAPSLSSPSLGGPGGGRGTMTTTAGDMAAAAAAGGGVPGSPMRPPTVPSGGKSHLPPMLPSPYGLRYRNSPSLAPAHESDFGLHSPMREITPSKRKPQWWG